MKYLITLILFVSFNIHADEVSVFWNGEKSKKQSLFFTPFDGKPNTSIVNNTVNEKSQIIEKQSKNLKTTNNSELNIPSVRIFGGCIIQDNSKELECVDDFFVGTTEITNLMYSYFDKSHNGELTDIHPVVNVSLNDINNYIAWLNKNTGKKYRLPTIAEWKYITLAGFERLDTENICQTAVLADCNNPKNIETVNSKSKNNWGIYDLIGNVWEVVGSGKFVKGGSWLSSKEIYDIDFKREFKFKSKDVGFRLVYNK